MDTPDGLAQGGAEVEQRAGAETGDGVAAAESFFRPGVLDVFERATSLFAEVVGKVFEDRLAALFGRQAVPRRASAPPMKPSSTPGLPSLGVLSNVTVTGPLRLTVWPVRPSSRQNGLS